MSCALNLALAQSALAAEEFRGHWTLEPSKEADHVRFGLSHHSRDGSSQHESDWPVSAFQGLDLTANAKRDVQFTVSRDAGRLDCEGYLKDAEGAGVFRFAPDPKYVQSMGALGFSDVDDEKQFAMVIHDVSLEFAKAMKAENIDGLDTDKLIAFRIHGVTAAIVREIRKTGLKAGADQLIALRIHGATPEWIAQMAKNGYSGIDVDELIAFRIHEVTPAFIERIEKLGYKHPEPDQLVAMRIHGVTPEYIADLKSHGMKDLSIDQLVSLRIHGID